MKYNVKPSNPKQFCYDVHIFSIEREVLQKNIEKYRNTPLKKFKLNTIYLLGALSVDGYYNWFYFVIIPFGSWYMVGYLPLYHDFDNEPDTESKYVTFSRHHIDNYNSGNSFQNLDYNTVLESLKRMTESNGVETIIFPLHPTQEFLFMNWKENPFDQK